MKNSAVVFSIFVAVIIALFLVFSIFGILYFYWGDATAVKDSLATIAGFFGGFATLGAAVIAAYLFNDWKEQERVTFIRNIAHETANLITQLMLSMQQYTPSNIDNFSKIKILQTHIITNLSFLNKQIKDDQMCIINKNFGIFTSNFFDITILEADNLIDAQARKEKIRLLIKSYSGDFNFVANLVDIDIVYSKTKTPN